MNLFFYSIFIFIFLITLNFIINKSEFHLDSNKSSFHKKITGQKKIPLYIELNNEKLMFNIA